MEFVKGKTKIADILAEVLGGIPAGFVFDDVYVIERLAQEHQDEYLHFLAIYANSDKHTETAGEEITRQIAEFEGSMVEEQKVKVHFPTLHSSLTSHRLWKKI